MTDASPGGSVETTTLQRRVVLIGASNLTRGMANAIQTAQGTWELPLHILVAAGLGRSYGLTSRIMGRALPSILSCGLWDALEAGKPLPTAALLTDVGNDLLYGASVKQLVRWVKTCIERLQPSCDRIVLARLPLDSLARLGRFKYAMMRRLLFPGSRLTLRQTVQRAEEVDFHLEKLVKETGAIGVQPPVDWYGVDPIHIRRRYLEAAWATLLQDWNPKRKRVSVRTSWLRRWRFRFQKPLQRHVFGVLCERSQPSVHLSDGSTVSLY